MRIVTTVVAAAFVLAVAGCGGDEDSTTGRASSTSETAADTEASPKQQFDRIVSKLLKLSAKRQVELFGNSWAPLFGGGHDNGACFYEGQPLCERIDCERPASGPIENCTPPSPRFRRSFADATVKDVAIKGDRAAAQFSNGDVIELAGPGPDWLIDKLGGNAGDGFDLPE